MKYFLALMFVVAVLPLIVLSGDSCVCTLDYRPVCSTCNETYGNLCQLNCDGAEYAYDGECRASRNAVLSNKNIEHG